MRLSNITDRTHVTGAASDNLEGMFGMLPTLRTGEVIIVGEAVNLPLRATIDPPPEHRRPDSLDPQIYDPEGNQGWNAEIQEEDYSKILEKWRSEDPRLAREDSGNQ